MPFEDLEGWGMPAQWPVLGLFADHTRVQSNAGDSWGCHGRNYGGTQIAGAAGRGDITVARCIADANGEAGIRYWTEGVCHQMANRILFAVQPTPVTVSNANGYWWSRQRYTTYGLNVAEWVQRRSRCLPGSGGPGNPTPSPSPVGSSVAQQINQLYDTYFGGRSPRPADLDRENYFQDLGDVLQEECALVGRDRMGEEYDRDTARKVADSCKTLLSGHRELMRDFFHGKVDARHGAERSNQQLCAAMELLGSDIGPSKFRALFEISAHEPINLVDPEVVAQLYPEPPVDDPWSILWL